MIKAQDMDGNETTHPVIYVALGSHANYSKPDVIRSPSMYKPGKLQRLLFWFDGLINYLLLRSFARQEKVVSQRVIELVGSRAANDISGLEVSGTVDKSNTIRVAMLLKPMGTERAVAAERTPGRLRTRSRRSRKNASRSFQQA